MSVLEWNTLMWLRVLLPFAVVVFMAIAPRYFVQMMMGRHNTVMVGTVVLCVTVFFLSAAFTRLFGDIHGLLAFGAGGASIVLRMWDGHYLAPWLLQVRRK